VNEKTVFLFDGTSFAYRAFYAIRELTTSKGFPTNAIFGFARMFLKLYKELNPEYVGVAFDISRKTFREKISADYKANRKPAPDDFKIQLPYIKKFLECLGIPVLEKEGFEADDILGTLSVKLSEKGFNVVIISPDKDIRQLITKKVSVLSISPQKKTETLYNLENFSETFGYNPSQIPDIFGLAGDTSDNIPGVPGIGEKTATKLIKEFVSLENLYSNLNSLTPKRKKLLEDFKEQAFISKKLATIDKNVSITINEKQLKKKEPDEKHVTALLKELEMNSITKELKELFPNLEFKNNLEECKEISPEQIEKVLKEKDLFAKKKIAILPNDNFIVSTEEKTFCHTNKTNVEKFIRLADEIFTFNLKDIYHKTGIAKYHKKFFDISIAEYLLNSIQKDYSPEKILKKHLKIVEIENTGKISHHAINVGTEVKNKLKQKNLLKLYKEIEHPLIEVLYYMEKKGVLFDTKYMEKLKINLNQKMKKLESEIFAIAGENFNINSPKQLSKILFEKLKIKPTKKTKSGFSTDVEVLTTLSLNGYEIANHLLEYRKLSKLTGTFIDGIMKHADPSGRVHTSFFQTGTATGRLSSAEPNLQNLPVSDDISKQIRNAVIPPENYLLLWADYSQIELRVLAHLSKDEKLIKAYTEGKDIHTETASILFNISPDTVTSQMRKIAKMVNFGIIYGMSPQGLAQRLGISINEAKEYIENYFHKFPTVKEFIKKTVEEAHQKGFVTTLFGRRRPVPELKSKNSHLRNFGERAAFNAIIQGTAADIMKIAMIKLFNRFKDSNTFITLQVHDEIVMEVPKGKAESIRKEVKEIMETATNIDVPLTVDINIGERWE